MAQKLTREQKLAQYKQAFASTQTKGEQLVGSRTFGTPSTIDPRKTEDIGYGATSFAGRETLPGEVSGREKVTKQQFMEAGGTKETGLTSAQAYQNQQLEDLAAQTGTDLSYLDAQAPKQTPGGDPKDYELAVATFEKEQFRKQAEAIARMTVGARASEEQRQTKDVQELFKEREREDRILNPEYEKLTEQQRLINQQLPEDQQIQQFMDVGLKETQLTPYQRRALTDGIQIRATSEQRERNIRALSKDTVQVIDPISGQVEEMNIPDLENKLISTLGIREDLGESIAVEDGKFVIKSAEGEIEDPIDRAEAKLQKKKERALKDKKETHRVSTDRIMNAHRQDDGTLTEQGIEELGKIQDKYNEDLLEFDEDYGELLDKSIKEEKEVQFKIEQRLDDLRIGKMADLKEVQRKAEMQRFNELIGQGVGPRAALGQIGYERSQFAKDPKAKKLAEQIDDIQDLNISDGAKFEQIYNTSDKDLDSTYNAFKARFGKSHADQVQNEFLERQGWDDLTINSRNYAQDFIGLYNGDDTSVNAVANFVSKSKQLGIPDEYIAQKLDLLKVQTEIDEDILEYYTTELKPTEKPLTKVQLEAQILAGEATPEQIEQFEEGTEFLRSLEDTGDLDMISSAVDDNPKLWKGITSSNKDKLLSQGYLPPSEAFKSEEDKLDLKQQFDLEEKLVKGFDSITKEARGASVAARKINTAFKDFKRKVTEGGDLNAAAQGVIITWNKSLDPTSVVRESEYARTGAGQSLLNRIAGKVQDFEQGGAGVTEETVKTIVDLANEFSDGYEREMYDFAKRTEGRADDYNLKTDNIFTPDTLKVMKELEGIENILYDGEEVTPSQFRQAKSYLSGLEALPDDKFEAEWTTLDDREKDFYKNLLEQQESPPNEEIGLNNIITAETKGEKEPFIRTRVEVKGDLASSAYGPAQITRNLMDTYSKKKGFFTPVERKYAKKFITQGDKFIEYEDKGNNNDPIYGLGGSGEDYFRTDEAKELYIQIAEKMWQAHVKMAKGDTIRAAEMWRGKKKEQDPGYFSRLTNKA